MLRFFSRFTVLAALARVSDAEACAPAPPEGASVVIEREDALIVWDAAARREHFVRRARFGGATRSFGFLVPTPSKPELAEADDAIFERLGELTAPPVVTKAELELAPIGCTMLPFLFLRSQAKSDLVEASAVNVLAEQRVAGLDATVLEATSGAALAAWLSARGFAFREALESWVAPYLARGWKITAFRYGDEIPAPSLASRALRLSFATDTAVYPYREPADQPRVPGRELRLFVVSSYALEAQLDDGAPWGARLLFSDAQAIGAAANAALPGVTLPARAWLQEYRDQTERRPAADIALARASTPRAVHPAPIVRAVPRPVPVPYELPVLALGLGWWWKRRQRRSP